MVKLRAPFDYNKKELSDRASIIIETLEPLSDVSKEIVLEMVRVAFPKLKTNKEDTRIIKDEDLKVSGGPKLSKY